MKCEIDPVHVYPEWQADLHVLHKHCRCGTRVIGYQIQPTVSGANLGAPLAAEIIVHAEIAEA